MNRLIAIDVLGLKLQPLEDAEVARRDRAERKADALLVLNQLPAAFQKNWQRDRLQKAATAKLAKAALGWSGESSFVVMGPTGVGKSTAAAFLFRRFIAQHAAAGGDAWARARGARWYPAVELERARIEHKLGVGDAPEVVHSQGCALLVIDDAGQDRDASAIREVLAARYDARIHTILTTNMTRDELSAHYGGAFIRKLVQSGGHSAVIVDCHPKAER